jgi:rSAM/selenodomain-associated transferase 1
MAKAPLAEQVKTRLIGGEIAGLSRPLNGEDAADLYAAFLSDTFAALEDLVEERESLRLVLAYTPVGEEEAFEKVEREGSLMLAQRGEDLGARLTNCFSDLFEMGYERVVIIGGDSPTLPMEIVEHAFDSLDDAQSVVLGPTVDGGYYLIGLQQLHSSLFEGVAWSSPQVLAQTRERIAQAKLTLLELPEWYDVDTPEDVTRLQAELAEDKELGYYTRRCLKTIARRMRESQS